MLVGVATVVGIHYNNSHVQIIAVRRSLAGSLMSAACIININRASHIVLLFFDLRLASDHISAETSYKGLPGIQLLATKRCTATTTNHKQAISGEGWSGEARIA